MAPQCVDGLSEPSDPSYLNCFAGTSASAPLAAGAAGLLLSVRSGLDRVQVQRLLQDTTDKIDPSRGAYDPATGFGSPWRYVKQRDPVKGGWRAVRADLPATHAWGRINAFEAVRIVAPSTTKWSRNDDQWRGGNGVDVFIRDNKLDWGNTEQQFHAVRPDISAD